MPAACGTFTSTAHAVLLHPPIAPPNTAPTSCKGVRHDHKQPASVHSLSHKYLVSGQLDSHPSHIKVDNDSEQVSFFVGTVEMYLTADAARFLATHLMQAANALEQTVEHEECDHPFYNGTINGTRYYHMTAYQRIERAASFTIEQCRAALELPDLQKKVRAVIEHRLKRLEQNATQVQGGAA